MRYIIFLLFFGISVYSADTSVSLVYKYQSYHLPEHEYKCSGGTAKR